MRVLVFVGLIVLGTPVAAQPHPIALDLVVGAGTSRFTTTEPVRESPFKWALGLEGRTPLGQRWQFVTGVNLLQRGDRARLTSTDIEGRPVSFRSETSLHYVTIPALIRTSFGGALRPHVAFGPEAAIQVGCQIKQTLLPAQDAEGSIPCWDGLQDVTQFNVHRFDVGFIATVGATLGRLGLEVRYGHGLRDVYRVSPINGLSPARNRSVAVLTRFRVRGS